MSAVSLMDCMEQGDGGGGVGGGTVLLESYESSCDATVPLNAAVTASLDKDATVEMESTTNTEEDSKEKKSEDDDGKETQEVKKEEGMVLS